jgi:hypothetical protein
MRFSVVDAEAFSGASGATATWERCLLPSLQQRWIRLESGMDKQQVILKNMARFRRIMSLETSAKRLSRLAKLLADEREKLCACRMAEEAA